MKYINLAATTIEKGLDYDYKPLDMYDPDSDNNEYYGYVRNVYNGEMEFTESFEKEVERHWKRAFKWENLNTNSTINQKLLYTN